MSNFVINYKNGFTPVGYTAPEDITYQDWLQAGEVIKRLDRLKNFAMGDWMLAGERKFGQMYSQALDDFEWGSYGKVSKLVWVAKQVAPSRRRQELSWTHHHHVAKLAPEGQVYWLQFAIDNELSCDDLRESIAMELNRQLAEAKREEEPETRDQRPETEREEEDLYATPRIPIATPSARHDDVMETSEHVREINRKRYTTTINAELPVVMKPDEHESFAIYGKVAKDAADWWTADHCLQVQNQALHLRDLYRWPQTKYLAYYTGLRAEICTLYAITADEFEAHAETARLWPPERRRQNETLTYMHHYLLRNRTEDREYYLQRATIDGWSATRLAEELRGIA